MQMSNNACILPGVGSPMFENHAALVGTASSVPQNLVALSLFLSTLACNSTHHRDAAFKRQGDSGNDFEYMKFPIAKVTDVTESSKKLVKLTEEQFPKKHLVKVGDNIHVAIGYALANSIMVEGTNGIVIIDATESEDAMLEIMDEFRKITKKPVKAVILTHFHSDHILGTHAIIQKEKESHPGEAIEVLAHESIFEQMLGFASTYGIGYKRAYRQLGAILPKILGAVTGSGVGPFLRLGKTAEFYIPLPTTTYRDRKTFHMGGLEFQLIHTPGETEDQTMVWFPNERAAFPGDNIYKAFPNLYTIRGSPTRDAKQWYESIDKARALGAQYLVGSHGQPLVGTPEIRDTLLAYRDAIKYVHDQTLRLLNKGYFPNEVVEMVKLPDTLADNPYLQEHYGTVAWSVRGIFTNYLGWFSGDPKDLHPMTESARAEKMMRLVAHASNRDLDPAEILLQDAQQSHVKSHKTYLNTGKHDSNEDKWALEVADMLLESKSLNENLANTAKQIKISALRALGSEEVSANGRNYYMTYAMEVESGKRHLIDSTSSKKFVIETSPVRRVLDMICSRVDGLRCQHENITVAFSFSDIKTAFTMTLRNSVCDIFPGVAEQNQIHLSTTAKIFKLTIAGKLELDAQIAEGKMRFPAGSGNLYKKFLACFDSE